MNFLKAGILKTILILLLIGGGGIFIISLPKIFGTMLVNTIDWLIGGTEPKYDESGKMIYDDGRKTIESFGTRKEFAILRFSLEKDKQTVFKKARWSLYERDNNKSIDTYEVEKQQVIGKGTNWSIPYIGYYADFIYTHKYLLFISVGVIIIDLLVDAYNDRKRGKE